MMIVRIFAHICEGGIGVAEVGRYSGRMTDELSGRTGHGAGD